MQLLVVDEYSVINITHT